MKTENVFIDQILKPSQIDICFSEKCNLNCDYCFVNKTSEHELTFEQVKKALDQFFLLPNKEKTVTFTTSEPFLHPELFKNSVEYAFKKAKSENVDIKVIATTNGVLFNKKMRDFVGTLDDDRFTLNFSLDGDMVTHDAHRKFNGNGGASSFEKAIANFKEYEKRDRVRVITTITPAEVKHLKENVQFILGQGFKNIDLFPQMLTLWPQKNLRELQGQLAEVVKMFNKKKGVNVRLLNRLWGVTHYAKILLGSDGMFYLFEWILPLEYSQRKSYQIGSEKTLHMEKRRALFMLLFENIKKKIGGKCEKCTYKTFCANPLPLYLWCLHNKKDFNVYYSNFCSIAKTMIQMSKLVKDKNLSDSHKWEKHLKK